MKRRALILQEYISDTDGSSVALRGYLRDNTEINYVILSRTVESDSQDIHKVSCYEDVKDVFQNNTFDVIHYFKIKEYILFKWTLRALNELGLSINIITTINQRPSYKATLLSPDEIKYSDNLVFIDKTGLNDNLLLFVPENRKECIYYCSSGRKRYDKYYQARTKWRMHVGKVIFGRGSTLNKCPKDMIANFNKIRYENKEFRIYGVADDSWVADEARSYSDIFTCPTLPLNDWYNELSKLDVFLYQIPTDSHSSLDGTLGAAMLMGIPVVYWGSDAPKERLIHGVNGFIANNADEFVEFSTMLANDPEMRVRIGDEGRASNLRQFNWKNTVSSYNRLYFSSKSRSLINVPMSYKIYFYKTAWRSYFRVEIDTIKRICRKCLCLFRKNT